MVKVFHDVRRQKLDIPLAQNFLLSEFNCKCGWCPTTAVDTRLIERLQQLRDKLNSLYDFEAVIIINSGYRCPEHNRQVKGSRHSQHMLGKAADIVVPKLEIEVVQTHADDLFYGVGYYPTFTHVDVREGDNARWNGWR